MVLPARREAGRLDGADRAVFEPHAQGSCIIDRDVSHLLGAGRSGALLDKRLFGARQFGDLAAQVAPQVDHVRTQVAERAAAGLLGIEAPHKLQAGRRGPVLQVASPEVVDVADAAVVHHPLGQRHRGNAPVVVHDEVAHARTLHGGKHLLGLVQGVGQRLLADDVLAGLSGGHGHGAVHVAGRNHVNDVNIVACHDRLPVRGGLLPAEGVARLFGLVGVAPADHNLLEPGSVREVHVDVAIALAVGLAHELCAEQRDTIAGTGCRCLFLGFQTTLSER